MYQTDSIKIMVTTYQTWHDISEHIHLQLLPSESPTSHPFIQYVQRLQTYLSGNHDLKIKAMKDSVFKA